MRNIESIESQLKRLTTIDKSIYFDYLSDLYKSGGDINDELKRTYMKYLNLDIREPVLYDFFRELENLNEDFDIENGDYNDIIVPVVKQYVLHWRVRESQVVDSFYKRTTYGFSEELIQQQIEDDMDYFDGEIYDTTYIDSDILDLGSPDIEEI